MGAGGDPTHAVYGLMAANAAVFLLWNSGIVSRDFMSTNFMLSTSDLTNGHLLNLVTCAFSHYDLSHILFNMIGLYSFGQPLAHALGARRFVHFYVLGGVAGSLSHIAYTKWKSRGQLGSSAWGGFSRAYEPKLLGASGAVNSLVAFFICMAPTSTILVFGIVPIPGWLFGMLYMGYDISGLYHQGSGVGHAAHIGGACMGLMSYLALRRGRLPF